MKLEDYPLIVFEGRRLRRVPELPPPPGQRGARVPESCTMCLVVARGGEFTRSMCERLRSTYPRCDDSFGDAAGIYLPEEDFQEYVVELVRRRVSS